MSNKHSGKIMNFQIKTVFTLQIQTAKRKILLHLKKKYGFKVYLIFSYNYNLKWNEHY